MSCLLPGFEDDFRCIVIDSPWPEKGGGGRGTQSKYTVQEYLEIPKIIKACELYRPHVDGCHLWIWSTSMSLPWAMKLIEELGFVYLSKWAWVKMKRKMPELAPLLKALSPQHIAEAATQKGIGRYKRGSHEDLLLARSKICNIPLPDFPKSDVIYAERYDHSAKPDKAFDMIRNVSPGPRLSMFERPLRKGFTTWGFEAQTE